MWRSRKQDPREQPGTEAVSVASVGREIEVRRHTDADGDVLTAEGVRAALAIGAGLSGEYELAVSTGAQRTTQTLACFLAALAQQVPGGVIVEPGLRSEVEERWRWPTREREAPRCRHYAKLTPSSSRKTRSGSAPRSAVCSTTCRRAAAL